MVTPIVTARHVVAFGVLAVPAFAYVGESILQPLSADHMRAPKTIPLQSVPLPTAALSSGSGVTSSSSIHIGHISGLALIPDQIIEVEYNPTPHLQPLYVMLPARGRGG